MKTLAIATVAGLATAASAQVIDLSGLTYDAAVATPGGSVAVPGGVTAIQFDLAVNAGNFGSNISWGSEVQVNIDGPGGFSFTSGGGDIAADLTYGWGDSSGTFTFSGSAAVAGGAGTYSITIFDTFDDAGTDGVFLAGSTVTFVPAPGAAAPLGLVGLSATRRRR